MVVNCFIPEEEREFETLSEYESKLCSPHPHLPTYPSGYLQTQFCINPPTGMTTECITVFFFF